MQDSAESLQWEPCAAPVLNKAEAICIGARVGPGQPCLAHLDMEELRDQLKGLAGKTKATEAPKSLDGRGVHFTKSLLDDVISALPKDEQGRPSFKADALFDRATFDCEASFATLRFERNAVFTNAVFKDLADFTRATLSGWAYFGGAKFAAGAIFDGVTFESGAGFERANFAGGVTFGAIFNEGAWFEGATFEAEEGAAFEEALFKAQAEFTGAKFRTYAWFSKTIFENARRLGPMLVGTGLSLNESIFKQRIHIQVCAGVLWCQRTRFLEGANLSVRWAQIELNDAGFSQPSILAGPSSIGLPVEEEEFAPIWLQLNGPKRPEGKPWVKSLSRADVKELAFSNVDLQACELEGAHNLDKLRLESLQTFTNTPELKARLTWPPVWRWTQRKTLAEERKWRARYERGIRRLGWDPLEAPQSDQVQKRREAREIAKLYRALRKGSEDNKDEPGAADFYYGEMEMRRNASPPSVERVILFLYWLISGYGLRAWRSVLTLLVAVLLFSLLFVTIGFADEDVRQSSVGATTTTTTLQPPGRGGTQQSSSTSTTIDTSFGGAVAYSGRTALGLTRNPQPELTRWGDMIQISVRIIVPGLLGLAILAIRGRVKR